MAFFCIFCGNIEPCRLAKCPHNPLRINASASSGRLTHWLGIFYRYPDSGTFLVSYQDVLVCPMKLHFGSDLFVLWLDHLWDVLDPTITQTNRVFFCINYSGSISFLSCTLPRCFRHVPWKIHWYYVRFFPWTLRWVIMHTRRTYDAHTNRGLNVS